MQTKKYSNSPWLMFGQFFYHGGTTLRSKRMEAMHAKCICFLDYPLTTPTLEGEYDMWNASSRHDQLCAVDKFNYSNYNTLDKKQ